MKKIILILVILSIFLVSCETKETVKDNISDIEKPEITNFEECIAAGNPAMESYPRQCSDGVNTFVEDVNCVPATCCHPTECVLEANAPDCSGILCSQECAPGTMDCGQGRCVFDATVEGSCYVEWTSGFEPEDKGEQD